MNPGKAFASQSKMQIFCNPLTNPKSKHVTINKTPAQHTEKIQNRARTHKGFHSHKPAKKSQKTHKQPIHASTHHKPTTESKRRL